MKATINGKQVAAPVEIVGTGRQNGVAIDTNHILTAFRKGNAITSLPTAAIREEQNGGVSVYYLNKQKAISSMQSAGLQLPSASLKDGYIHSMLGSASPVKTRFTNQTLTQQLKRWFEKSKTVNQDGTARIHAAIQGLRR